MAQLSSTAEKSGWGDHCHLSDDGLESLSFDAERPIAADKFQDFLERLPADVFRAKGILWIAETEKRHVFHLVGQRFTLDEGQWVGPRKNRLVLIGRNLDKQSLRAQLEACLTAPLRRAGACAGN